MNLTPEQIQALREEGKRELWYRGDLRHVCRPHGQTQAYDFIHAWKAQNPDRAGPIVLNCRREFGKTFFMLLLLVERCIKYPDQETRFGAPLQKQGLEIVRPILKTLLDMCPPELIEDWTTTRVVFKNLRWGKPNARSNLTIVGCKDDAESQRGPRSDMVDLDECREIPNFGYVVKSVFGPHFLGRNLPLMVMASTPPNSADHAFIDYVEEADRDSRYFLMPGSQDLDMTPQSKQMLMDLYSVTPETLKTSPDWQREVECSLIPDPSKLVVPEFQKVKDEVVVPFYERPKWYFPHVCMDFGFIDFSAVLFGYNDFENQTLVIEDEVFVNYETTRNLYALSKAKEEELYKDPPWPAVRFGDNNRQQLADMTDAARQAGDKRYGIRAVDKDNKKYYDPDSARARLRTRFQTKKIRILSRCKSLIHQLNTALRKENGDFERSEKYGHADAIAALIYLNRMLNFDANPFPSDEWNDPNVFRGRPQKPASGTVEITREPLVITHRRIA